MKILYYIGWIVTRIITKLFFRIKIYGRENIPKDGGFIIGSNHISFYDPPIIGSWNRRQIYFLAKHDLFKIPVLGFVIKRCNAIPVKRGVIDRSAIENTIEIINNNYGITIFPEGTRSLTDDFLPAKPGIGIAALQAKCPIVPTYLHGNNSLKDCFWGRKKMSITFGKPILFEVYADLIPEKESYLKVAQDVMAEVAKLKQNRLQKES